MTRPIKKARVTRRRKYYGGGKRRGGTTLKKVGGGEASNLRPTFEDDLWNGLTLGDIIKGNEKSQIKSGHPIELMAVSYGFLNKDEMSE